MIDLAGAYSQTHDHLAAIVAELDGRTLGLRVPASPAWDVKDVVAHVAGLAGDVVAGRAVGELNLMEAWRDPEQAARRDAMTAAQVEARRSMTLDDVLGEWSGHLHSWCR